MEGFELPGSGACQLTEGMHDIAGHAVVTKRQVGRIAEVDELLCPLLVQAIMRFVDLGVRIMQVFDRAYLDTIDRDADLTIVTVDPQHSAGAVKPGRLQPHATSFRITGNQLVSGVIDHLDRVCVIIDRQRCGQVQLLLSPQRTGIQGRQLYITQAAAKAQLVLGIKVLDRLGHPVVTTSHIVQGQITTPGRVLVAALAEDRTQVAGLAAVEAGITILVVGALGPVLGGRIVNRLKGSTLQVGRQVGIIIDQGLRNQAGLVFAESSFHHAVFIGRIVKCSLVHIVLRSFVNRTIGDHGFGSEKLFLGTKIMRQVADCRVGNIVAGSAEVNGTDKVIFHELVTSSRITVGA